MIADTLKFTRPFRDSVHGTIRLSDEEARIIEHPLFFRLHQIRQNGLLYYVFPSATHTRFEHSLGVLHISDLTLTSLIRNSYRGQSKGSIRSNSNPVGIGEATAFDLDDQKLITDLRRILRIAALVHDLGHGPFSHTFDAFAPEAKQIAKMIQTDGRLKGLNRLIESLTSSDRKKEKVEHEEMSCIFFAVICDELIDHGACQDGENFNCAELPSIISAIILGKPSLSSNERLITYLPLLHDLIASAPVDVDRMDYLERDSKSIGVTYGLFDRDRLLDSFLFYKSTLTCGNRAQIECLRLGIKFSGMRAVENFIQARYELFVQVYYHKTNSAINSMLEHIAHLAAENKIGIFYSVETLDEIVDLYTELSDFRFLRYLQGKEKAILLIGPEHGTAEINKIATNIAKRKLWKRIWEGSSSSADKVRANLGTIIQNTESLVCIEKVKGKATKDLDTGAALLKKTHEGIYASSKSGWLSSSKIIASLAEEETAFARIFYKGNQSEELKLLRSQALKAQY